MAESLNCIFYTYTGDPRVANKNLGTAVHTCSVIAPIEPLSDLDIKLIIDYPYHVANYPETGDSSTYPESGSQTPAVMSANYVAIDNLYYQITNKERLNGNALAIYATIDGMKSYWGEISACDSICKRSSNGTDSFIPDATMQTYGHSQIDTIAGTSPFSSGYQFILTYLK